jgi:hypothetical protein
MIPFFPKVFDQQAIERLRSIQLLAQSHDQGFVDDPSAGNWTWFELAIFENASAQVPKVKDNVKFQWTSHHNRMSTEESDWVSV